MAATPFACRSLFLSPQARSKQRACVKGERGGQPPVSAPQHSATACGRKDGSVRGAAAGSGTYAFRAYTARRPRGWEGDETTRSVGGAAATGSLPPSIGLPLGPSALPTELTAHAVACGGRSRKRELDSARLQHTADGRLGRTEIRCEKSASGAGLGSGQASNRIAAAPGGQGLTPASGLSAPSGRRVPRTGRSLPEGRDRCRCKRGDRPVSLPPPVSTGSTSLQTGGRNENDKGSRGTAATGKCQPDRMRIIHPANVLHGPPGRTEPIQPPPPHLRFSSCSPWRRGRLRPIASPASAPKALSLPSRPATGAAEPRQRAAGRQRITSIYHLGWPIRLANTAWTRHWHGQYGRTPDFRWQEGGSRHLRSGPPTTAAAGRQRCDASAPQARPRLRRGRTDGQRARRPACGRRRRRVPRLFVDGPGAPPNLDCRRRRWPGGLHRNPRAPGRAGGGRHSV